MPSFVDDAIAEAQAGHVDRAQQLFKDAVRRGEQPGIAWAWIAHRAADCDDWQAALDATEAALVAADAPWWAHHIRGVALTRLGRAGEAILVLQRAAVQAPGSLDVAVAQARAAIAARDIDAARRAVGSAQRLLPADARTRRVTALFAMLEARWADAESELRALLHDEDNLDVEALTNLGVVLAAAGCENEAGSFFRRAMIHGEVTIHHRVARRNLRRYDTRHPSPRQPKRQRVPLGVAQLTVIRWALVVLLAGALLVTHPLIGVVTCAVATAVFLAFRRHRPRGRYTALPEYIDLMVASAT